MGEKKMFNVSSRQKVHATASLPSLEILGRGSASGTSVARSGVRLTLYRG